MAAKLNFLTNHAYVLLCVAHDPGIRLRDIATSIGITERGAHKILTELIDENYVLRERRGRRNHYTICHDKSLGHPLVEEQAVGELLKVLLKPDLKIKTDGSGGIPSPDGTGGVPAP